MNSPPVIDLIWTIGIFHIFTFWGFWRLYMVLTFAIIYCSIYYHTSTTHDLAVLYGGYPALLYESLTMILLLSSLHAIYDVES